ncbi:uncharacterized protein SCHCODRAFT_02620562 [Schizophyllum commune H4-8]|uniref:uncharacterized protein n=1 Tax=Schizophyllum commune (strain H4-8 / FGSC 9210) TaxID=578458 RepID=UPI00215EEDFF|nr:uncharacterized protein SCHCODRAFT_02620562 [Schizophyllum commune H4-8]KAI5892956.1 hypothetical protein SCHCODRAFT_02620562 [Schizophyllum commune H4-8]
MRAGGVVHYPLPSPWLHRSALVAISCAVAMPVVLPRLVLGPPLLSAARNWLSRLRGAAASGRAYPLDVLLGRALPSFPTEEACCVFYRPLTLYLRLAKAQNGSA